MSVTETPVILSEATQEQIISARGLVIDLNAAHERENGTGASLEFLLTEAQKLDPKITVEEVLGLKMLM